MSEYQIAHTGAVNTNLLDTEMRAALPNKIEGLVVAVGSYVTVNFTNTPSAQDQTDAAAVVAAHDPNILTEDQAIQASATAMIADFAPVSSPVMDKITELQGDIRTAWENNTWDIGDIFPGMRTRLQENTALYTRYLNFLRQGFAISQATFEGSPTVAQQRNSYIAAIIFINTGGYHSLFKVLFD